MAERDEVSASAPPEEGRRTVSVVGATIDSADLFARSREVLIAHGVDTYRLRLTSQNKLILTK